MIIVLNEIQLKKLNNVFSKYEEIQAAYLFGSYAEGKENRLSDIDIGVVLGEIHEKGVKIEILKDLAYEGFCNVDPVILNEASPIMKFEIVKHNKLIYKKKDFNHPYYFSDAIRRGLDFKPFIKVQRKYYKERLFNDR